VNRILCNILATALEFGTISSGANAGEIIQVVTATDSTQRNTTSTSFVTASNTLSVSITPSSASNKIFILVTTSLITPGGTYSGYTTIYRGATNLGNATYGMGRHEDGSTSNVHSAAMSYLDSPNTTSATTYQIYIAAQSSAPSSVSINSNGAVGSITCFEIKG
jgi:hypothetical protein